MKHKETEWLQLFAEGGGDGGGAAPAGAGTAAGAAEAAPAAEPEDLEAGFDELVGGKYKDVYGKRVQKAVASRIRGVKGDADRYKAMAPAMQVLAARYGVRVDDPSLVQKIAGDRSLLEDLAMQSGHSTEVQMALVQANAEKQQAQEIITQIMEQQDMLKWSQQAEQVRAKYPGFDLDAELQNPQFKGLLKPPYNLDVGAAYLAIHGNDVLEQTVKDTEKRVAAHVASGRARPKENGAGAQAPATIHVDPMNMTRAEYKAYAQRIARGEKISFG